jgi:hypothetical protein
VSSARSLGNGRATGATLEEQHGRNNCSEGQKSGGKVSARKGCQSESYIEKCTAGPTNTMKNKEIRMNSVGGRGDTQRDRCIVLRRLGRVIEDP